MKNFAFKFILSLALSFLFSTINISAQSNITIDLSENENDVITESMPVGKTFEFTIINKLPNKKYEFIIEKKINEIDVLTLPEDFPKIKSMGGGVQMCASFLDKLEELNTAKNEKEIPKIIDSIKKEIKLIRTQLKEKDTTDAGCIAYHVIKGEEAISSTSKKFDKTYKLKRGEKLELTIIRKISSDSSKTWKRIYSTPKRGKWVTSYGLSFITNTFNKEESYFLKSVDSTFAITKKNNRQKLRYAPSVFFTWMPTQDLSKNVSYNFTAGLGFDLEAPTAFLGISAFYNQNISLVAGVVTHKQKFLNGIYEENQILKENLSEDQLHENLYTINPFISLTFRFGSNIFKPKTEETSSEN